MESIASQKAGELQASVRSWLEKLFGRSLAPDEQVTVTAFPPHPAPESRNAEAVRRIEQILDQAATNMADVAPEEFADAVDEAMRHVRKPASALSQLEFGVEASWQSTSALSRLEVRVG